MVVMLVVVVLRDARRAYKLHTIALTPFSASLQHCRPPTRPIKITLQPLQLIYLTPLLVPPRKSGPREPRNPERILRNEENEECPRIDFFYEEVLAKAILKLEKVIAKVTLVFVCSRLTWQFLYLSERASCFSKCFVPSFNPTFVLSLIPRSRTRRREILLWRCRNKSWHTVLRIGLGFTARCR